MILGTVKSINENNLTLLIDGETEPTAKEYKQNGFYVPKVGDRVTIDEINGSYVVTGAIGKNRRYTLPIGTDSIEIQLEPGKLYVIAWFEIADTVDTVASRMAMVGTLPDNRASSTTQVTQFASSGSSNPFSGMANFRVKITKVATTRIGYVTVMEL